MQYDIYIVYHPWNNMIISLLNGSKVKTFSANSIEEMKEHAKRMDWWEERFYKIGNDLYHINGRSLVPIKLKRNLNNGEGKFDEILPP